MGDYKTKLNAKLAAEHMKKNNFYPKTILNIGIGPSHGEKIVWLEKFPESDLMGVDIRGIGRWGQPFVNALVTNKETAENTKTVMFCWACKSIKCNIPEHKIHLRPHNITTIDKIVEDKKLEAPFFMWIDIEGAELDALKGATETLPKIVLINIEMREFQWTTDYCSQLHSFLVDNGFKLIDQGEVAIKNKLEDKLYQRIDWKPTL